MRLHRSNLPSRLVDRLCAVIAEPVGDPLAPECIVVQGKGMERWLSMQLAARLGIWANPEFPFPQNLLARAFTALLGPGDAGEIYAPDNLVWSVAAALMELSADAAFEPLQSYLESAGTQTAKRRVQLAERITWVFDRYLTHRPGLIERWERGEEQHWQAKLWRLLYDRHGPHHFAARARAFVAAAGVHRGRLENFPRRVSLFGVSSLPPIYLEALQALSQLTELHLFILSPSKEYWAEIRSRREIWRSRVADLIGGAEADLDLAQGHPLLASLGTLGRDFQALLEGICTYEESEEDLYVDPAAGGEASLLASLQADVLHLRPPSPATDDGSIRIHACHSPLREIEVLRDQLLGLFEADPTLEPRDVVIMTPSVETYAPFVEAVFDGDPKDGGRIPCRIADRRARAAEAVIDVFGCLLELIPGRCTAADVLELLAITSIRERFDINEDDLPRLHGWVAAAGVRWGADGAHRAACGQPDTDLNTWRFGLDRLLLGYAMPGGGRELFAGILPCDEVEGGDAVLLGRLCAFGAALFSLRAELQAPRALPAWREVLDAALERLVMITDDNAHQHQMIREALEEMATGAERAGYGEALDLATVWRQLERRCQRALPSYGFLSGGVTFCDLVPMRSIPFRVVCLVGLDDEVFPRREERLSFDLMTRHRQLGDRDRRDDDRYSFLEAVLAAREHLVITFLGQGIADNAQLPPSVVLADLLDTLGEAIGRDDRAGRQPFVVRQPLQAMSPRYFGAGEDERLFSFSHSLCSAAQRRLLPPVDPVPFAARALPPVVRERRITIDDLERFFSHPVRALLRGRLGIWIDAGVETIEEREPVSLTGIEWFRAGEALLSRVLTGEPVASTLPALTASGLLPHGTAGRLAFRDLCPVVEDVGRAVVPLLTAAPLDPVAVDLTLDDTRLVGLLGVQPNGQLDYGFRRVGAARELRVWIRHLVLNLVAAQGGAADHLTESAVVGLADDKTGAEVVTFTAVADPAPLLADLVRLYWLGHRVPLPFFPAAARAFVAAGDDTKGLEAARKVFAESRFTPFAEGADPHVRLAFGDRDPLVSGSGIVAAADLGAGDPSALDFSALAAAIFTPLLAHRS